MARLRTPWDWARAPCVANDFGGEEAFGDLVPVEAFPEGVVFRALVRLDEVGFREEDCFGAKAG
jgi:hypothetical protein